MKTSIYTLNKLFFLSLLGLTFNVYNLSAQTDSNQLNMDAVFNRPNLKLNKAPVTVGGYLEANSLYSSEDGVSEGLSFQARRLTLFMSATITKRIKFLTEMEFEEGGKAIGIEFAAADINISPQLNIRGGIVMNPIGSFNQNHDGPKWEFVDRPEMAVNLLPATWSNPGFGVYGKTFYEGYTIGYEGYLTNGFDNSIIDNEENKTFLPASKDNSHRFEESSNGEALFTGKVSVKKSKLGELGLSYMGGVFNKYESEGVVLDKKRRLNVFAIDYTNTIKKTGTSIKGELAYITVDVPSDYSQRFGNEQMGWFIDIVQPVLNQKILDWDKAVVNVALRMDYVDWNMESFSETGHTIGDDLFAITPAVSLRPTPQTVFRLNYRYQWQSDLFDNPAAKKAAWMIGFSTYF